MDIFAKATRNKVRFPSSKGNLSVEDVWDLQLPALNTLAKNVNASVKAEQEESFIEPVKSSASTEAQLQMDIVLFIIDVKLKQREAAQAAAERKQKREQLDTLIAEKKLEGLKGSSLEDLEKLREEL